MPETIDSRSNNYKRDGQPPRSIDFNLSSSIARTLHYWLLQMQQIRSLQKTQSYETLITLTSECREELIWWVKNLKLNEGKTRSILTPDLIIQSNAAKIGVWWLDYQGLTRGGQRNQEEKNLHINTL